MGRRPVTHLFCILLLTLIGGCTSASPDRIPDQPLITPTPCDFTTPPPISDLTPYQTPLLAEPDPRVPYRDPAFGTCVVRVTDWEHDFSAEGVTAGLKNEYSRVQSFNADGSLITVLGTEGSWFIYDGQTLELVRQISVGSDPRWDASDPDMLYYAEESRLMALNVRSDEQRIVHDFAADLPGITLNAVWTRYEGSPSYDGRYWGLMAEDQDWLTAAFLIYDQQLDEVIALRMTPDRPEIDSVSISALGTYFLAYYDNFCERGQLGTEANPCGLMVYDRDLQNGRSLVRTIGHSDAMLDGEGREVLVYQEIDTDHISMLDLESGAVTDLLPIDFSDTSLGLHFSGRASNLPGWALVSTHNSSWQTATWMADSVFAVELKPEGRVLRLAHTHSLVDEGQEHDYWAEPQASVNADFTRVVFTSNWGRSGTDRVDMYLIELPPDWTRPQE